MKTIAVSEVNINDFLEKIDNLHHQLKATNNQKTEKTPFFSFLFKKKDNDEASIKREMSELYKEFFIKVIQRFLTDLTGEQSNHWLELYNVTVNICEHEGFHLKGFYQCSLEAQKKYQKSRNTITAKDGKEFYIYGFSVYNLFTNTKSTISQFDINIEMMEITSLGYIDQFVPFQLRINLDKNYQPLTTLW